MNNYQTQLILFNVLITLEHYHSLKKMHVRLAHWWNVFFCFTIGIYQPETFKRETKYGLTVLTSTDDGLLSYLNQVMSQMESWLLDGNVQRLVVVVTGLDSEETLERWQFNVAVDQSNNNSGVSGDENAPVLVNQTATESSISSQTKKKAIGKSIKEIHNEIQAIIRQITASVSVILSTLMKNSIVCCNVTLKKY